MRLFACFALLTLALSPSLLRPAYAQDVPIIKAGSVAPLFRTKTVDGKRLSLKSLRGKVVLIDVWATWCGPCREVMPIMESLHQKYSSKGLKVIGLSMDDSNSMKLVKPFQKAHNLTYTLAVSPDANAKIAEAYHAETLPSVILIDRKGIVRWSHQGFELDLKEEERELNQRISSLLGRPTAGAKMAYAGKK